MLVSTFIVNSARLTDTPFGIQLSGEGVETKRVESSTIEAGCDGGGGGGVSGEPFGIQPSACTVQVRSSINTDVRRTLRIFSTLSLYEV
jgi:hypothetical protein